MYAAGRDFDERDSTGSSPVIIVNEAFVQKFVAGQRPLGATVEFERGRSAAVTKTIVGVVGNIRRFARDDEIRSEYYEPFAQAGDQRRLSARLASVRFFSECFTHTALHQL